MDLIGALLTLVSGILATLCNGQNGTLGGKTSFIFASTFSYGVGVIFLSILWLVDSKMGSDVAMYNLPKVPWWSWFGGVCGASAVLLLTISTPRLGASIVISCLISMQMISSVVFDSFGLVGFRQVTPTPLKLVGSVLLIVSILVISIEPKVKSIPNDDLEKDNQKSDLKDDVPIGDVPIHVTSFNGYMIFAALSAGTLLTMSAGMAGQVALHSSNTFSSFLTQISGTLTLCVYLLVDWMIYKHKFQISTAMKILPLWAWFGFIGSTFFVAISTFYASKLGSVMFTAFLIAGQVPTALICDQFGIMGVPLKKTTIQRVIGIILLLVSVILVTIA
ncbi:hypothetical protein BC833DRAFT_585707 [Globomyces pollinis-pini]|nr:hypothetical protein BC833DRAFT_585707 [Globomyces pollinis-pini]